MIKIFVDTEKEKEDLLRQSEYIHDFQEKDSHGEWNGLDVTKALTLMHIYTKPDIIIVKNKDMKTGIELIAEERQRQIEKEGWTSEHDDQHKDGELANAAASYAMTDETIDFINNQWGNDMQLHIWGFELEWYKRSPENRIRDLEKAGALIAAEIDRLNRAKEEEDHEKK